MGSLGNWYALHGVLPEDEERSPWQPFHVQKGFKPTDSIASVFFGGWYTHAGVRAARHLEGEDAARARRPSSSTARRCWVLDPIVARGFVDRGFDTKEKLIDWCAENALLTAREYWDNQWIQTCSGRGPWPASSRMRRGSRPNPTT